MIVPDGFKCCVGHESSWLTKYQDSFIWTQAKEKEPKTFVYGCVICLLVQMTSSNNCDELGVQI